MQRRKHVMSAICASLVALALLPDGARAAPDTTECLAAPNRKPDDGQHWYFRTDRTTNQKCWYLREQDTTTAGSTATTGSVEGSLPARPSTARQQTPQAADAEAMNDRTQKALFRDFLRWYKERGGAQ